MKRFLIGLVAILMAGPVSLFAADAQWVNSGIVTVAPQINATNVINNGTMSIFTSLPFSTSNTENFTNRGIMSGTVGWQFDYAPTGNGVRRAARVFHNHPQGTVVGSDKLLINATNLINEGLLSIGEAGRMSLVGTNVNLRRGGLQVQPFAGVGTAENTNSTLFLPDTAIIDNFWGIGTNNVNTGNILDQIAFGGITNYLAIAPPHNVQGPRFPAGQTLAFPAIPFVNITNAPPVTIVITNDTGTPENYSFISNYIVQAVFVGLNETNIGTQARFTPSGNISNLFSTLSVELSTPINNPVTTEVDTLTLYIVDRLTTGTNFNLSTNDLAYPVTLRPSPYLVQRPMPIQFALGRDANTNIFPELLYDPLTFSNAVQSTRYAAYGFTAGKLAVSELTSPGDSITNTAGRIEINTPGAINLERTRFRSDGLVTIKGKHLISSTNALMDAWNLNFDLGSTNGTLRIRDLAKTQVDRFGGDVQLWSGTWSNTAVFVITNNFAPDTNEPPNYLPAPITNSINYGFHVMIVDASRLTLGTPVVTYGFTTRSTNVYLADPLLISDKFFTEAERFTVEGPSGAINLFNLLTDWNYSFAPNLRYLTNYGTISVPNEARFGYELASNVPAYAAFVNYSNLTANGVVVRSAYFENGGILDAGGQLTIDTLSGRFENGVSFTGGDLDVRAHDFKFRNATHQSLGALNLVITNSLFDNGSAESNRIVCGDGFHISYANGTGKPTVGDLLGTSLETAAPIFASIDHTWPADDRGAVAEGFTNNLALGQLVLSVGFDAEMVFSGAGVSNAMYVDFLSFQGIGLNEVETALVLAPNLVIYFADSNLPAEQLDGMLGGRLRWVKSYAGPYSGVDLLVNGNVIKVNRALRNSLIIDSDGDGLANGFDANPFDPAILTLSVSSSTPLTLALNWNAAAKTIYKVEYTTNNQTWNLLKYYTNSASGAAAASVVDQVPVGSPQRYYRVGYQP